MSTDLNEFNAIVAEVIFLDARRAWTSRNIFGSSEAPSLENEQRRRWLSAYRDFGVARARISRGERRGEEEWNPIHALFC